MSIGSARSALLLFVIMACFTAQANNEFRVILVPGAPIEITSYSAAYRERSTYRTEGIHHTVTLRNTASQDVVAVSIGFLAFDAFKRDMGSPLSGVEISTLQAGGPATEGMTWVQTPRSSFTFDGYGIGVSYVRAARMADGTIWNADMDFVLRELRTIADELELEDLAD